MILCSRPGSSNFKKVYKPSGSPAYNSAVVSRQNSSLTTVEVDVEESNRTFQGLRFSPVEPLDNGPLPDVNVTSTQNSNKLDSLVNYQVRGTFFEPPTIVGAGPVVSSPSVLIRTRLESL